MTRIPTSTIPWCHWRSGIAGDVNAAIRTECVVSQTITCVASQRGARGVRLHPEQELGGARALGAAERANRRETHVVGTVEHGVRQIAVPEVDRDLALVVLGICDEVLVGDDEVAAEERVPAFAALEQPRGQAEHRASRRIAGGLRRPLDSGAGNAGRHLVEDFARHRRDEQ